MQLFILKSDFILFHLELDTPEDNFDFVNLGFSIAL